MSSRLAKPFLRTVSLLRWYWVGEGRHVLCFWAVEIAQGMAPPAIAMLHPAHGIGPIAAFEPLHLAHAQLQQTGGFAYAQPSARCILNHFHPLELFLTHRHHPYRVTKSRCS
jgi:hypothetical protein